jgi:Tol biopolymer transport system component
VTGIRPLRAALVTALAAAAIPAVAQAATNGPIAYVRSDDPAGSNPQIWVMAPDGSNPGRLTTGTNANYSRPSFAQPGSKLAYAAQGPSSADIFTMDFAGTGIADLSPDTAPDSSPALSPDGSKVAYSVYDNSDYEIFVRPTAGGAATQLTTNGAGVDDLNPAWSPDGTKIAFASTRSGSYDIWVMDANGSSPTQLTNTVSTLNAQYVREQYPTWSPEGSQIAYTRMESNLINDLESFDIWVMNATGTNQHRLAGSSTAKDTQPAWSPDGTKLVFASDRSSSGDDIWVVNSDGSGSATDLTGTASPISEAQPTWGQPQQPSVEWAGANPVVATAATVNAKVASSCIDGSWYVEWSEGDHLPLEGGTKSASQATSGCVPSLVSTPLSILKPNTTYTARFVVTNALGTAASDPHTFTTPDSTASPDAGGSVDGGANNGTGDGSSAGGPKVPPQYAAPPRGTAGNDRLIGTNGRDVLKGFSGDDVLAGLAGDDLLEGGPGRDILDGGPGNDRVLGGPATDDLDGGPGNDDVEGGPGADVVRGSSGNDHLSGGSGADKLRGGTGNDTIDARDGHKDKVDCGDGTKDAVYADRSDSLRDCERVTYGEPPKKK